ncbi:MAG: lipopolysaccharide biosynthesis protein, partial [Chitinophagaceae bacterium]
TAIFSAQGNFKSINFSLAIVHLIFITALFILFCLNVKQALLLHSYFIFYIIIAMVIWLQLFFNRQSFPSIIDNNLHIKQLYQYSSITLGANILFFFVYKIDYWLVEANCSAYLLGNYIQASKMGQLLLIIPQILASAIFPKTAKNNDATVEINHILLVFFRVFAQCFLLLLLVMLVIGKQMFITVFGNSFSEMHLPFLILLPGIFCLSMVQLISAYMLGKGETTIEITGAALALLIALPMCYWLIPTVGIIGAAIGSVLGYLTNMLYLLYKLRQFQFFYLKELFVWRRTDWLIISKLFRK